jgi:hypothetical protein
VVEIASRVSLAHLVIVFAFAFAFDGKIALLQQPLDELVNQLVEPRVASLTLFVEELLILFPIEQAGVAEGLLDCAAQCFKSVVGVEIEVAIV